MQLSLLGLTSSVTVQVFQGLYDVARFQYLLWQQHCNLADAHQANDYFGPSDSFSFMRQLGPDTCLLCPDTRAHRSTTQILAPATHEAMIDRCAA